MPKSFLYAVRDYRYGYYCGGREQGVNVMTTRSGLSIKKIGSDSKPSTSTTSQVPSKDDQRTYTIKTRQRKRHKSNNQLSFVTRYYMRPSVIREGNSNLALGDQLTKKYLVNEKNDVTESTDEEEDTNLDAFILSASENFNNNQTTNSHEILEQKEAWQGLVGGNVVKPNVTCPLVKYFADNRLPDLITTRSSENPSESSLLYATRRLNSEICGDNVDNRVFIKNNVNFVVQGSDQKSDAESGDTASSVSSDVFSSLDNSPLVQVTSAEPDESSNIETKLLKLKDTQLKVQFLKSTDGQKLIKCLECNRIFEAFSAYIVHLRTHTKSKSTCFLCGKAFSRSWLLKGHMRTHTGERPFLCTHQGCNKSFADKSNLRSHTLIHASTKKEHKCNKCGRSFAQKRYLHKHMQEVCRVYMQ